MEKLRPAIVRMLEQQSIKYNSEVNEGRIYVYLPSATSPIQPNFNCIQEPQEAYSRPQHSTLTDQVEPEKIVEEIATNCFPRLKTCCAIM